MSQLVSSKALTEGMLSPIGHHLSEQGGAKEATAAAAEGQEEEEAGSAGAVSGGISRSAAGGGGLTTVLDYLLDMPSTYPRFNPAILRAQPGGDGGKKKKQSLMQWRRRRPPPGSGGSGSGSAAGGGSSQSERVGPEWVSLSTQTKGDPAAVSATSPEAFAALPATEQVAHVTASLSGGGDDALAGARYIHCSLSLSPRAVSLLFAYLNSPSHTTLSYSLLQVHPLQRGRRLRQGRDSLAYRGPRLRGGQAGVRGRAEEHSAVHPRPTCSTSQPKDQHQHHRRRQSHACPRGRPPAHCHVRNRKEHAVCVGPAHQHGRGQRRQ